MNKREWSAHSLLVWTPLLKPQLRTCCKSIFCLFVYNVDVSMNTSKSRRPIFSHFDRLYLLYKKILYGEEARCIFFSVLFFSAKPKEEILSEHDKPILSASVANQNAVFALSFPFKFQSLTRQELVSLTRDQALLLFFFPLFFGEGREWKEKVWKMSHERHDSKTGEDTTSGQYYAFLQDMITVKNYTSKALLSIRRGLFYDGFHFRRDIYRKIVVC